MGASSCTQTVLMCFCYVRIYPWAQVHTHQHNKVGRTALLSIFN